MNRNLADRLRDGVLVRVLRAGRSGSGRVYTLESLEDAEQIMNRRVSTPVHLGHASGGAHLGRIVHAELVGDALWGQLFGIPPDQLIAMREGATALGLNEVGVSIKGAGTLDPSSREVIRFDILESIDICSRSEPHALAGGKVCFFADHSPVPWVERHAYIRAVQARQDEAPAVTEAAPATTASDRLLDLLEARLVQLTAEYTLRSTVSTAVDRAFKSSTRVAIRESNCGRLLAPLA